MKRYRILPQINGEFSCEYQWDWIEDKSAWHWMRHCSSLERAKKYIEECQKEDRRIEEKRLKQEEFRKKNPPIYV